MYMQVDSQESSRKQKKAEILENLQRLYPGVVSGEGGGNGKESLIVSAGTVSLWLVVEKHT